MAACVDGSTEDDHPGVVGVAEDGVDMGVREGPCWLLGTRQGGDALGAQLVTQHPDGPFAGGITFVHP